MSTPNEFRVFISSTFRDLLRRTQRAHPVKNILPEMIRPSAGVECFVLNGGSRSPRSSFPGDSPM